MDQSEEISGLPLHMNSGESDIESLKSGRNLIKPILWDTIQRVVSVPTAAELDEFDIKKDEEEVFLFECALSLYRENLELN
jgi:hypothetical protein